MYVLLMRNFQRPVISRLSQCDYLPFSGMRQLVIFVLFSVALLGRAHSPSDQDSSFDIEYRHNSWFRRANEEADFWAPWIISQTVTNTLPSRSTTEEFLSDHTLPAPTFTTSSPISPPTIGTLPSRSKYYETKRMQESDSVKDGLSSATMASTTSSTATRTSTTQSKQDSAELNTVRGSSDSALVKDHKIWFSTTTISSTTPSTIARALPSHPASSEASRRLESISVMVNDHATSTPTDITTTYSSTSTFTISSRDTSYEAPKREKIISDLVTALHDATTTTSSTTSQSPTTLPPYTTETPNAHESIPDLANDSMLPEPTALTTSPTATHPSHPTSYESPNIQESDSDSLVSQTLPDPTTTPPTTSSPLTSTTTPTTLWNSTSEDVSTIQNDH